MNANHPRSSSGHTYGDHHDGPNNRVYLNDSKNLGEIYECAYGEHKAKHTTHNGDSMRGYWNVSGPQFRGEVSPVALTQIMLVGNGKFDVETARLLSSSTGW